MPKKVLILGSTGSIGEQALEVVQASEELELCGLSAGHRWERLCEQARDHGVSRIALSEPDAARSARGSLGEATEVLSGDEGVRELVTASEPDLVLNAIVGFAGLAPTIVALSEGIDLALANKESLIAGGELVTALAEAGGAKMIPVDSEHSALHQLLRGEAPGTATKLVLTASGGPFRGRTDLEGITPEEALAHPTWEMGGRITVDSATLMNKGFEVIEAHHLFGFPYDDIDVVVHPQSIVHALVQLNDGASLAHLGHPDMRIPISYGLHHPERADVDAPALDLASVGDPRLRGAGSRSLRLPPARARGRRRRRHCSVRAQCRRRGRGRGLPRRPDPVRSHRRSGLRRARGPAGGHSWPLRGPVLGRRGGASRRRSPGSRAHRQLRGGPGAMSTAFAIALAIGGIMLLVIFHELGHFFAARACGMRVERLYLGFGRPIWKVQRGETEYGVGWIPAGGYAKITGMNPEEDLPEEVRPRAYYNQPVWKRIVVIGAGPAVNVLIAFVILFGVAFAAEEATTLEVGKVVNGSPADGELHQGDRIVSVDGQTADDEELADQAATYAALVGEHECAGAQSDGCRASEPVLIVVERDGRKVPLKITPVLRRGGRSLPLGLRLQRRRAAADRPDRPAGGDGLARPHVAGHVGDRLDLRPAVQGGGAREAGERGRGGRDHPAGDSVRRDHGAADHRARLAVAGPDQPLPVPAARRRAHLLEPRREGAGQNASRCARWSRRA